MLFGIKGQPKLFFGGLKEPYGSRVVKPLLVIGTMAGSSPPRKNIFREKLVDKALNSPWLQ
jgi:hypothetical protein